jgi:D-alanyl-D-alanine carboxypeptidase
MIQCAGRWHILGMVVLLVAGAGIPAELMAMTPDRSRRGAVRRDDLRQRYGYQPPAGLPRRVSRLPGLRGRIPPGKRVKLSRVGAPGWVGWLLAGAAAAVVFHQPDAATPPSATLPPADAVAVAPTGPGELLPLPFPAPWQDRPANPQTPQAPAVSWASVRDRAPPDEAHRQLKAELDQVFAGGDYSVLIIGTHSWAEGFDQIYARNPDEVKIPASVMKVPTAVAAIKHLLEQNLSQRELQRQLDTLTHMVKNSDNDIADRWLRDLGGASAISKMYGEFGLALNPRAEIANGSGDNTPDSYNPEGRDGALSARDLVQLLSYVAAQRPDIFQHLEPMLPDGGSGDGTLHSRFGDLRSRISAKTGTMPQTRVRSLAGYVWLGDTQLVFAAIGNQVDDTAAIDEGVRRAAAMAQAQSSFAEARHGLGTLFARQ